MVARRKKRHPLDDVGPETAIQIRCGACRRIVMVGEYRDELLPPLIRHFEKRHAGLLDASEVNMILEGEGGHFVIEKVPASRCDLCGVAAERPWWVWVTPWTPDYDVKDPEWCVCDGCDRLVREHATMALCRRVYDVGAEEFVVDDPGKRRGEIATVVTGFLNHVDPALTYRETVTGRG